LVIVATSAMAGEGDAFRSATAGFEITKPADWHYLTAEQNQENLSRVELTDDEYKEALLKYATVPLVAMVKYAEPFDDLNPSVKVNIKPLGELKGMAATELWIVPRGDYFFLIGAGTRQDEKTGGRDEIGSILATMRIEPQLPN